MLNSVKKTREENGLTQEQLAALVQVSRQSIISIERSQYVPSTILALKLSKALNTTVESLFKLEKKD